LYAAGGVLDADYSTTAGVSVTLYAKWTANTYTLTYDYKGATGGNSAASAAVTYGSSYTLAVPTKTGYSFGGWYSGWDAANNTVASGTQLTNSSGASLAAWAETANVTVYAQWTGNAYILTYDYKGATGGNSAASAAVTYGSSYTLAVPMKTGYSFGGWYSGWDAANNTVVSGTQLTNSSGVSLAAWTGTANAMVYARWAANIYTVTYDYKGATNGDSAVSATVTYGSSYTLVVPTKTGSIFGGWYSGWDAANDTVSSGTQLTGSNGASLAAWTGTADTTVYAKWTARPYLLTDDYFGAAGGNCAASEAVTYGASYTLAVPTKTGYIFGGWYSRWDDANDTVASGTQLTGSNGASLAAWTGTAGITVYAKWTIITSTLIYDYKGADGGNSAASTTVTYGYSYTLAVPMRTGYTFDGWWTGDNGTGTQLTNSSGGSLANWTGTSNITVYAKWTIITSTLIYDYEGADGGNSAASVTVSYGSSYTLAVPTKTGYTFGGWWTGWDDANDTVASGTQLTNSSGASLDAWMGTANATVYAQWTVITSTLTYDYKGATGGNSAGSTTVSYGSSYTLAVPTKTGYTFGGWWTGDNGTGTQLTNSSGGSLANWTGTANATVYAKWTVIIYTLTYDYKGATGGNSAGGITVTYDSSYTLAVPTKTGYTFGGWYSGWDAANNTVSGTQLTNSSGGSLANWTGTANATVYAKWTVNTYTLTYDYKGATGGNSAGSATVTYGASYTLAVPTKTGYTFGGWYSGWDAANNTVASGTQLTNSSGASLANWTGTANATVYAKWTANTYTVIYNANGGSVSPAQTTVTYGASYSLDVPTRAGYTFHGWYAVVDGANIYLTDETGAGLEPWTITVDITVNAIWNKLTFNFNGVTVNGNASVTQLVFTVADIPWPVKAQSGMVFLGWYDAATGGTLQSATNILAAFGQGKTFYAHWYTVASPWTYDSATGGMVINYGYSGAAAAWTAPSVDGTIAYTFEAWGGNGGNASSVIGGSHTGGVGGYAKGTLSAAAGTTLYLYTGAAASTWNGGGERGTCTRTDKVYGGRGGGASSVSLSNGAWDNTTVLAQRILVAGGGGGADFSNGQNGGGLSGASGSEVVSGYAPAGGGTQTAGGTGIYNGVWGAGGQGGISNDGNYTSGGGGGGGYYGGGGDHALAYGTGGGGGSGYVFGLAGCGDTTHHPALVAAYPQYQFSNGVTKQSGETGYVTKPSAAGSNGYIRVSYLPPATAQ
jgi:uncharacterized repeat protein (TIGR02543 family)